MRTKQRKFSWPDVRTMTMTSKEFLLSFVHPPFKVHSTTPMSIVRTGDVSVEQHSGKLPDLSFRILLLGGTGSGKSSFIEALSGRGQQLGISGSTLESVTQEVHAYKVVNVQINMSHGDTWPIYVVDTPGFSDAKRSEAEVVSKIEEWMDEHGLIDAVYYCCRINDKRIPGSAQTLIKIVKSLGIESKSLTIVTTMWDALHGEDARKAAEGHFAQLRDDIWKVMSFKDGFLHKLIIVCQDKIKMGAKITKFQNIQASAIEILKPHKTWKSSITSLSSNGSIRSTLLGELLCRIENARQHRHGLLEDRTQLLTLPNPELDTILSTSLRDVDQQLTTHIDQLVAFDAFADDLPQGFDINIHSIAYQSLLDITLSLQQFVHAIQRTLAQIPSQPSRQAALKTTLRNAKRDCMQAYNKLHMLGQPPPEFQHFIPDVSLTTSDRIALQISAHTKRLKRRIKMH
ncbi:hypothetical protein CVT24_006538 [Panaeolus cyanescens]|uniref:G domain-containing protein n=1 Tax=Panaeolus cyanescens TaxID=181874 RepID=A0A409WNN0_9AGAR|nr:hypothetical protein CVT24_006538 [Panaeolus cyanescens]